MGNEDESLRIILGYAREQYARVDVRHESIVSRSTTFLGFLAVFIGLVAAAPLHGTAWRALSVAGLVIVIVAVCLFVSATRLRAYSFTPDTMGLINGYLDKAETETRRMVLSNTRDAIRKNEATLRHVQGVYQWGVTLAAIGTIVIGIGAVAALVIEFIK